MALIRSVTLHLPHDFIERAGLYRETLENIVRELSVSGYSVWTKRVSLPLVDRGVEHRCRELEKIRGEFSTYLVSGVGIDPATTPIERGARGLVDCMERIPNLFSSVLVSLEQFEEVSEFLREFYRLGSPGVFTRFAGVVGSWVATPYFPASVSLVDEPTFSIALRYVDLFDEAMSSRDGLERLIEWLRDLEETAREVSGRVGARYGGIDLSLSPWMEESVGMLVEKYSGSRIDRPGAAEAVYRMNLLIEEVLSRGVVTVTGFNEVMLPLEEDGLLKKRASEGVVSLTTLLRLTPYCVAGLDMVVVSRRFFEIEKIVRDLVATHRLKKRPLGFRVIPVDREPGEKIYLERFGEATVVSI